MNNEIIKAAKKFFSGIGFRYVVFFLLVFGGQILLELLGIMLLGEEVTEEAWFTCVLTAAPVDIIGAPILYLLMRKIEKAPIEKKSISIGTLIKYTCMLAPITFAGSMISLGLSQVISLITGSHIDNNLVLESVMKLGFWGRVITACVCAPIFEELVFRKLLIDRTVRYGEWVSVVLSGVMFGLFHGNFEQFFYACFLGMFFGYIYIKTGKIIYTMILHFALNFSSSGITMTLVSKIDLDKLDAMTSDVEAFLVSEGGMAEYGPTIMWFAIYMLWICALIGIFIAGLVFWIMAINNRPEKVERECELPKEKVFKTVYLNPGMIIYILLCLALCVIVVISQAMNG